MNRELIMKTDVLDILFEKRNKLYGAYILRKFYNERLMKSIAGMLGLVVVFISFSFIENSHEDKLTTVLYEDPSWAVLKPAEKKPVEKPLNKVPSRSVVSTQKFTNHISIVVNKDSADKILTINKQVIGSFTITAPTDESLVVGIKPGKYREGEGQSIAKPEIPVIDITAPVSNPEIEPSFPGGMDALRRFLQRNLTNPKEMEEGEAVSVKVKFVVGYDGKLQRFETIEDGGSEFNNEVVRVLKKMPEWVPGKSGGRNVSVYYTIPVKFVADK